MNMGERKDVKVLPAKKILDGKGCIWEWSLAELGWNELPDEQKVGHINDCVNGIFTLKFPALNHITDCVYRDEFDIIEGEL